MSVTIIRGGRVLDAGAHRAEPADVLIDEAGVLGLGDQIGRLAPGYRADIVLLDHPGPRLVGRRRTAAQALDGAALLLARDARLA